jgi:hypothetical protein
LWFIMREAYLASNSKPFRSKVPKLELIKSIYLFEVLRSSSSFTKKSSGQMSVFHWSPSSLVAASVNTDFFQEEKSWSKGRRFETINPSLLTPIQRWTKRSIQNSYQQQEYWKFKALKNLEKLYFLNYYS